jgi:hypothetical protein
VREIWARKFLNREQALIFSSDPEFAVTGLSVDQIREAIWGESADKWRQSIYLQRRAADESA